MHTQFLKISFAILSLFALQFIYASSPERPNVLFISIDDLNDWTGYLGGHPNAKTPNIDALASNGTAFMYANCVAPACGPSRASLMTGVLPSNSGVYYNSDDWREAPLLKGIQTIPMYFRNHGYKTLGSGKIFHGPHPDSNAWDEYWPSKTKQQPRDKNRPPKKWKHLMGGKGAKGNFNWGPTQIEDDQTADFQVVNWVKEALSKKHDKPFFLACGIFRPHLPWYVHKKYFDMHPLDSIELPEVIENDLDDIPLPGQNMVGDYGPPSSKGKNDDHPRLLKHKKWKEAVQAYLACISYADACVGELLESLKNSTHAKNTIVVLWSDHGWHLGEKEHWRKFALWEDTARCNMIYAGPGIKAGQQCNTPVSLLDIYPTLLDLSNLPVNDKNDGLSLKPLIENTNSPWERPALNTYGPNNHSLRVGKWRYIQYADHSEELYNHDIDHNEWKNLAQNPEWQSVKDSIKKWLPTNNVTRMVPN